MNLDEPEAAARERIARLDARLTDAINDQFRDQLRSQARRLEGSAGVHAPGDGPTTPLDRVVLEAFAAVGATRDALATRGIES